MRLTAMQWSWSAGAVLYLGALLLDIFGLVEFPLLLMILVAVILLGINLAVGPSLKDLSRANRRSLGEGRDR